MEQLAQDVQEAVELRVPESQPDGRRVRVWSICATVVILWLAFSSEIQDSFRRSLQYAETSGVPNDFSAYFVAGQIARHKAPENLLYYPPEGGAWTFLDLRVDPTTPYGKFAQASTPPGGLVKRTYPFIAPPFATLLTAPLASLTWEKAYFVWQLLSVLMMAASLYLALRLAQDDLSPLAMAIALAVVFLFRPFRATLALGNIDVAVLLLWVVGAFALRRRHPIPSALCFALGTAIKVSPIFAVPLLVMRRQWRWLLGYGLASGALLALSVWKVGWQNHLVWARQVVPALSWGLKMFYNRSLPGFVLALTAPHNLLTHLPSAPPWRLFNKVLSGMAYLGFLFWCWKQRKDSKALPFELIVLPLVVLLLSPTSWTNHYVLAVPALAYLWVRLRTQPARASNLDLLLLTASTMFIGSVLPDSAVLALGLPFELLVMAGWVAATGAVLWVGMSMDKGRAVRIAIGTGLED